MYVTVKQSPRYHQISLDDLFGANRSADRVYNYDPTSTRTFTSENYHMMSRFGRAHINSMILSLESFADRYAHLFGIDLATMYHSYTILKSNGKRRPIDEPLGDLRKALDDLKWMFGEQFPSFCTVAGIPVMTYHTSAFAYISGRSVIDVSKRHQKNESMWFGKFDLSNFFGSNTYEHVMKMLSMVYPFSDIMAIQKGNELLSKVMTLAFLRGGLPQGSPLSPLLTNIIMIPIDHILSNDLLDFNGTKLIYTRYADDFIISSRYTFRFRDVEQKIIDVMKAFDAPYVLNRDKTRYGSRAGQNWNLGVMLNKDNQLSIGYKKRKYFRNMLYNYYKVRGTEDAWDIGEIQHFLGQYSWFCQVDGKRNMDELARVTSVSANAPKNIIMMMKEELMMA